MPIIKSARWCAICYPCNMIDNWEDRIADILQLPGEYCIHTKPDDDSPDEHVHIIFCFPDNTTRKHALNVINLLSKPDSDCCSTVQAIIGMKSMHDYLCHETESCIKAGKPLYSHEDRIQFNGFDYLDFVRIEEATLNDIRIELSVWIATEHVCFYGDLYMYALSIDDGSGAYESCVTRFSAHFDRMCRAEFNKLKKNKSDNKESAV